MTDRRATVELEALRSAVGRSRAALAQGLSVDLSGLDAEVARITDIARNAPSVERTFVLAAMEDLLRELDGLGAELRRQRDAGLAYQAATAYRAEPGTP